MSTYGPEPPSTAEPAPDNHALKARLDAQVGLRVLKAGDTMTGELQMGRNMIRGLPQVYPPSDYLGDEAISWSQVVRLTREALEAWEPSQSLIEPCRKPLITVWAEENGALDGGYVCPSVMVATNTLPLVMRCQLQAESNQWLYALCQGLFQPVSAWWWMEGMCLNMWSANQPLREQASYPGLKVMSWLQETLSRSKPFGLMMKKSKGCDCEYPNWTGHMVEHAPWSSQLHQKWQKASIQFSPLPTRLTMTIPHGVSTFGSRRSHNWENILKMREIKLPAV